jgi:hypothetical protein
MPASPSLCPGPRSRALPARRVQAEREAVVATEGAEGDHGAVPRGRHGCPLRQPFLGAWSSLPTTWPASLIA